MIKKSKTTAFTQEERHDRLKDNVNKKEMEEVGRFKYIRVVFRADLEIKKSQA